MAPMAAPMPAPMPIGSSLPTTIGARLKVNFLMTLFSILVLNDDRFGVGITEDDNCLSAVERPPPSILPSAVTPSSPSATARTSDSRRCWSAGSMPWTSATASASSAEASRKNSDSPATAESAAMVPTPGKAAVAPTAPPLLVTVTRYCFSRRRMICSGVSSGCDARIFST